MHLKKTPQKNGRIHLSIVDGYYDKEKKHSRTVVIENIGHLDEMKKKYDDPIAFFEQRVQMLKKEKKERKSPVSIEFSHDEKIEKNNIYRKNIGYAAISKIYHELQIDRFLASRQRSSKTDFNTNNIMKLLVFSRILAPASKKRTYEEKDRYFENTDFSLDDVYRCLTHITGFGDKLKLHIHKQMQQKFGRKTDVIYYDVTNYYFETDRQDDLKRKGVCKEHRPNPIVQMGLLMDTNGIPVSYDLFPGNTNDCETLPPILNKVKKDFDVGRIIIVADKGLNTANNIVFSLIRRDGYVFSQTVRGGHKDLKEYVLDESGYRQIGADYKIKSRVYPREIAVSNINGGKSKIRIDEKQVVFYSADYAKKAKADRESALLKAFELIKDPSKYNKATSYGAAKYVKNLVFDSETGEIVTTKQKPVFDEERLREEEQFDGYYAIVTSELDKSDEEIIEIYRGLWRIEEAFKVTKSDLEARPVYLSLRDHIQAHFVICFVALVIARILEHKLNHKYSIGRIIGSLVKAECTYAKQNYYLFDYFDDVLEVIGKTFAIDFSKRLRTLGEIKKILAASKKAEISL